MAKRSVELMDTTLRDGEQTPGVAYTPDEKLQLARMLLSDVGVDRIEIAGTRVSEGEREGARRVARWAARAGVSDRIEVLGYCDGSASVDWTAEVGVRAMNLLVKGSERHCLGQLRMSPGKHRARVEETIRAAKRRRLAVNVYLEDWSSGVRESPDYVFAMMKHLAALPVERVFLADTLGVFTPAEVKRYVELMVASWPDAHFEFHGHNDYGLATANCLAAVEAGARGIHTSVNGMGERAGNSKLAEVVAALHDHTEFRTRVDESRLVAVAKLVETFSGKNVSANAPVVGADVFTQTAGIHADGDAKGDLYATRLAPDRFGQRRRYALGKLSGKASLDQNLRALGIDLPEEHREVVLRRIVELGDKKHQVVPEDLRFLIADVLKTPAEQFVRVESYHVTVGTGALPEADVTLTHRKKRSSAKATGDGGYDAFMNALKKAAARFRIAVPQLEDYRVRIPPGGRTGALVETVITWKGSGEGESFTTLGVDSDQLAAAVIATEKMLNAVAARRKR
jgi:D-citramalate synthase